MAGFLTFVIIGILILGGWYLYNNPEILQKSTITNPLDQFLAKNNTPSSFITETQDKIFFGFPFSYYNCAENGGGDNSCKVVYGSGTFCLDNQSNENHGKCYTNK